MQSTNGKVKIPYKISYQIDHAILREEAEIIYEDFLKSDPPYLEPKREDPNYSLLKTCYLVEKMLIDHERKALAETTVLLLRKYRGNQIT